SFPLISPPAASPLFPYTTLFRSAGVVTIAAARSVVEAIAGEDPNVTLFPLAEAQAGVVSAAAAAQVSTVTSERTRVLLMGPGLADRKSTRLNSSHQIISYAVFCL